MQKITTKSPRTVVFLLWCMASVNAFLGDCRGLYLSTLLLRPEQIEDTLKKTWRNLDLNLDFGEY